MVGNKLTPTQHERVMREDDFLVSKTDTKGRILYGNRIFVEFSGYSEEELLGKQHNIVRHPDMPRGVFKFLWDTIQARRECFAYVINMAKDGSHYWVFANVTPSVDADGRVDGYFSVRRKPRPEAIAVVSKIYRQMVQVELNAGSKDACDASLSLLNNVLVSKGMDYEAFVLSI
jgi:PAS domain S-box-containing protein